MSTLVGVEGFEPPTLWTQTRCASQAALHSEGSKFTLLVQKVKKVCFDFPTKAGIWYLSLEFLLALYCLLMFSYRAYSFFIKPKTICFDMLMLRGGNVGNHVFLVMCFAAYY